MGGHAGIISFRHRRIGVPRVIWCHVRRAGRHAGWLLSMPIGLLTRERRPDKGLLLQRTGLLPLRWRAVVRRHNDGGGCGRRGSRGVAKHLVDARGLQDVLQRLTRGRGRGRGGEQWARGRVQEPLALLQRVEGSVQEQLALLQRVQRIQWGGRVGKQQRRSTLECNSRGRSRHGEAKGAPLSAAAVWADGGG